MRSRSDRNTYPDRRRDDETRASRFVALASWMARRPKDALSFCLASAAAAIIVINALYLQDGPHPAPIFAHIAVPRTAAQTGSIAPVRAQPVEPRRSSGAAGGAKVSTRAASAKPELAPPNTVGARPDPIAELLEPSNRIIAVQQALAEFGYGQIRPTGTLGPETRAAIERFERERRMPVTGQISERLTRELAALRGAPL